jgi:cardiolipin synthase
MTVPNFITSIRIILTPIFIIFLLNGDSLLALILFVLAGLSDAADGLIARLFDQKSKLGAFLDPLADKILLISAFIMLSVKGYAFYPSWLTVIVISRDVLILLGVLILFLNSQDFTFKPSILSKTTTCLQLATVFVVLSTDLFSTHLPALTLQRFSDCLFWATGLLTIVSGLHYMRHWFRMMGEGPIHD